MDKTISISIGGFSFIIDDGAYLKLKNYLNQIRLSLKNMEGVEEVLSDVEARVAEIFREKLGTREVVNEQDVEQVIAIMGRPEQYTEGDDFEEDEKINSFSSSEKKSKKLYRDPDDKIIAGVLSGIAHYLGIETWITRIIWILLFFADIPLTNTSFTLISYIILWIILPKAETLSQKYEMHGQSGDFESIKQNISKTFSDITSSGSKTSDTLGEVLRVIAKVFLIIIGISFIFTGISLLIGGIVSVFVLSNEIPFRFFDYIVDYSWQEWTAKTLIFLLLTIPAILFIVFGFKLFSNRIKINRFLIGSCLIIWFLSIVGIVFLGQSIYTNFRQEIEFSETKSFSLTQDTLQISFEEFKSVKKPQIRWSFNNNWDGFIEFEGKLHRILKENIEVQASPDEQIYVEVKYRSKGSNLDDAQKNAEAIHFQYEITEQGDLVFDKYISVDKNVKYRDQSVKIIVYLPKSKTLHSQNSRYISSTKSHSKSKKYYDGYNKFFKFVDENFECLNCSNEKKNTYSFDSETSKVKINSKGIKIQDGDDKIIINKNQIQVSDGTDSINIDFSDN